MKVMIVPGWYPSEHDPSSGDFVQYQSRLLNNHGLDISVLFCDLNYKYLFHKNWKGTSSFQIENGLPTLRRSGFFFPKISKFILKKWVIEYEKLYASYLESFPPPDLFHGHVFWGGFASMTLSKKHNIPYLITEHSTAILSKRIPRWQIPIFSEMCENASEVIAVSHGLKTEMESQFGATNVRVIPNFIDTALFHPPAARKIEPFTFISIGSLIPRKRIDLLIQAFHACFAHNNSWKLKIIGDGPEMKSLKSLAQKLNVSEHVEFMGFLQQPSVARELRSSHVFISTSESETFGIVVIEAISSGLPVICTDSVGPSDIINDAVGTIVHSDVGSISEAMIQIHNQYHFYRPSALHQYVVDNFSSEVVAGRLMNLYSSVI